MKKKLTPRWFIIKLTGILFAAYAAYNVFVLVRDLSTMPAESMFVSVIVALLFGVLAIYSWTSEVSNIRLVMIRTWGCTAALALLFALKLRLIPKIIAFLDISSFKTVMYSGAYFLTLASLFVLLVYYAFIVKRLPFFPKASFYMPLAVIIMLVCGLALELVLFLVFHVGMEKSSMRTLVSVPTFYLSFIGLSTYFLTTPKITLPPPNVA